MSKSKWWKQHKDPFLEREQSKYEYPVPSREYLLSWLSERTGPAKFNQLVKELGLSHPEELEALEWRLRAMIRDGQLVRNRRGGFGVVNKMDLVVGRVQGHPDGFGFFIPDDGSDDLFLSGKQMRMVLHEDRVLVRTVQGGRRGRKEAVIVEVLERAHTTLVGRYYQESQAGFLVPDNKRISQDVFIPSDQSLNAKNGQFVVAEITSQPTIRSQPVGKIIEVLGDHRAPGMEIDVAMRSYDIEHDWSAEVLSELAKIPDEVPEKDKKGRVDCRHLPFVTIDGADARDFDDAVYCEPSKTSGWRLWVAIADVAHYVKPGTALDKSAKDRGNSVYFPDRVIPMLPEKLSNGLCSLNPKVDRLVMICEVRVSEQGKASHAKFYEGVIHSHARMTYEEVNKIYDTGMPSEGLDATVMPALMNLYELYQSLFSQRQARGALEFDSAETKIQFDETQKIENIVEVTRLETHRLIEECMLCANVSAAKYLKRNQVPSLYRVHSGPEAEKVSNLRLILKDMGLSLAGGKKPKPEMYTELLRQLEERPEQHLVQTLLLRSLNQAVYSPKMSGHFGLAYQLYTHFTSPIRRYPDLVVHRGIKHFLKHKSLKGFPYDKARLERLGEHCSLTERRADEATRDAIFALKCEFMMDKIGREFMGTISGVAGFGFFVELDDVYVDGLVHISSLDGDYYHYDPIRHTLSGERTGQVFQLGGRVKVRVEQVNLDDKKIDFEWIP